MPTENYSFLHAADLHIDSPLRGLERYEEAPVDEIRGATRRAFEHLVEKAIELEVAFVILAGDIFDGDWKDHSTGLWFAQRLRELSTAGIAVYLAAGNHDAEGKTAAALVYPGGVHRFGKSKPETFRDPATGAAIHGQSFAKAATTENSVCVRVRSGRLGSRKTLPRRNRPPPVRPATASNPPPKRPT